MVRLHCYTSSGKTGNWSEGARLPSKEAVQQLQPLLPPGHTWEPIAGTVCNGYIKKAGIQAASSVYNAVKDAFEGHGLTFLTVLGNRRGESD